jgi:two-component system, LytTR family, response regulator
MPIRVLIVDDEPLARKKIRAFLKEHADFDVVAECGSGHDASTAITSLIPDLLFLDIRIPDKDGFEVLRSVDANRLPGVIFTTAFDEYAVKAFEVDALDYLLKPFNRERFVQALARFRERWNQSHQRERVRLFDWLQQSAGPAAKRLVVKSNARILLIDPESVQSFKAEGDYVRINTAKQSYLMRETMHSLESRLDQHRFIRIHRSVIVNVEFVAGFKALLGGDYRVFMKDGTEFTMSRTFRKQLSLLRPPFPRRT